MSIVSSISKLAQSISPFGENTDILKRLFSENFSTYWKKYALAGIFMLLVAGSTALSAWIMRDIVNAAFVNQDVDLLLPLAFGIVAIFVVKGCSTYAQDVLLGRVGNRIIADVQKRVYNHVLNFGVDYFAKTPSSDLITRISGGANSVKNVMNTIVMSVGRDFFTLLGLILVMFLQAPLLSVITLLIAPAAILGVSKIIKRVRRVMAEEFELGTRSLQLLQETVYGSKIIKAFNLSPHMKEQMGIAVDALEKRANRLVSLKARSSPLMESLGGIAIGMILIYAGWASATSNQTPGDFIAFMTAFLFAYEPAKRLARLQLNLESGLFGAKKMFEIMDTPAASNEVNGDIVLHKMDGNITFDKVGFGYRPDLPVFHDITLDIRSNSKTALVGPSGGGKSTIFALIQRFYDVHEGIITIDGNDIRTLNTVSLRDHIAFVSQDTYLFSGTICDNIRIGRLSATDADIELAAKDAFAHEFICELPQGYQTNVGENGAQLSGGQRQRIAIARAMLKAAPILLLDEATSALDSQSEQVVQMAFDRLMEGRTTIVIAHRLSTVVNADQIIVLDNGRIIEKGTHSDLLAKQGLYSKLYDHQFKDEQPPQ